MYYRSNRVQLQSSRSCGHLNGETDDEDNNYDSDDVRDNYSEGECDADKNDSYDKDEDDDDGVDDDDNNNNNNVIDLEYHILPASALSRQSFACSDGILSHLI